MNIRTDWKLIVRSGLFYARVVPLLLLRPLYVLLGGKDSKPSQSLQKLILPFYNRLFSNNLDPRPFLRLETFLENQDTSDFFALQRKLGITGEWYAAKSVLDVGCGPGTLTLAIVACHPASVTGIDIEMPQVEFAAQIARAKKVNNVRFDAMSIYELDFPDNTFDRAVSQTVFEHLPNIPDALREMYRVLKPGGEVYLNIDSFRSRYGAHLAQFVTIPWPCAFFSEEVLKAFWFKKRGQLLKKEGFEQVPELLDFKGALPSLNRITMTEMTRAVSDSPFEVLGSYSYANEAVLLNYIPALKRMPTLYEWLRGSLAFRLRKPADSN